MIEIGEIYKQMLDWGIDARVAYPMAKILFALLPDERKCVTITIRHLNLIG